MWCVEAKAKIDIPLGTNLSEWTNEQFKKFIESKKTSCSEFKKAIEWLGKRTYTDAVRDCNNKTWMDWLKNNTPKDCGVVKADDTITITKGRNEEFALWHHTGIWDLPKEYVGETIRVVCHS